MTVYFVNILLSFIPITHHPQFLVNRPAFISIPIVPSVLFSSLPSFALLHLILGVSEPSLSQPPYLSPILKLLIHLDKFSLDRLI